MSQAGGTSEPRVVDVPERSRFEISTGDGPAGFAEYRTRPGVITFTHTEIDDAVEGRGLGGTSRHAREPVVQVRFPASVFEPVRHSAARGERTFSESEMAYVFRTNRAQQRRAVDLTVRLDGIYPRHHRSSTMLTTGLRIGSYESNALLGAGGTE